MASFLLAQPPGERERTIAVDVVSVSSTNSALSLHQCTSVHVMFVMRKQLGWSYQLVSD